MLRELCLRSGVLVPPELMQSSNSLAGSASLQVPLLASPLASLSRHVAAESCVMPGYVVIV